jgi:hypothetical protein
MRVDLLPLELYDFEVILGMKWLGKYKAQIDCFAKIVTLQELDGRRAIFKGERKIIPSCIISAMRARKLIQRGCEAYLAYLKDREKGSELLADILIIKEFPNVFLEELPRLPPEREVEVSIDIIPGSAPIA